MNFALYGKGKKKRSTECWESLADMLVENHYLEWKRFESLLRIVVDVEMSRMDVKLQKLMKKVFLLFIIQLRQKDYFFLIGTWLGCYMKPTKEM